MKTCQYSTQPEQMDSSDMATEVREDLTNEEKINQILSDGIEQETTVPLNENFLDALGKLYSDKLFETFAETKLLDNTGRPVTTETLLGGNESDTTSCDEDSAVLMDVVPVRAKKRPSSETLADDETARKKNKTAAEEPANAVDLTSDNGPITEVEETAQSKTSNKNRRLSRSTSRSSPSEARRRGPGKKALSKKIRDILNLPSSFNSDSEAETASVEQGYPHRPSLHTCKTNFHHG